MNVIKFVKRAAGARNRDDCDTRYYVEGKYYKNITNGKSLIPIRNGFLFTEAYGRPQVNDYVVENFSKIFENFLQTNDVEDSINLALSVLQKKIRDAGIKGCIDVLIGYKLNEFNYRLYFLGGNWSVFENQPPINEIRAYWYKIFESNHTSENPDEWNRYMSDSMDKRKNVVSLRKGDEADIYVKYDNCKSTRGLGECFDEANGDVRPAVLNVNPRNQNWILLSNTREIDERVLNESNKTYPLENGKNLEKFVRKSLGSTANQSYPIVGDKKSKILFAIKFADEKNSN